MYSTEGTIQDKTMQCPAILYGTINFSAVLSGRIQYAYSAVQLSTVKYSTILYSAVQLCTVHSYNTVQCSSIKYITMGYNNV